MLGRGSGWDLSPRPILTVQPPLRVFCQDISSQPLTESLLWESQVRDLSDTVAFQEDKINNLEHQRRSLERSVRQLQASHDGLSQQVLALEAELQAARSVLTLRSAEAVTQGVAIARVSRRVEAVERVLSLHGLD